MLRAVLLAAILLSSGAAFAGPDTQGRFLPGPEDPVEMLYVKYTHAMAKGEVLEAIGFLRQIVTMVPRDCDWRLRLAEALLKANKVSEAGREFDAALEIEPEFQEARIGTARVYALQNRPYEAKIKMLEAARRGYPLTLMMRKKEVAPYFMDYEHVLKLLEAERPEIGDVKDPFVNPLRRKSITPPPPGPPPGGGKPALLSEEAQRQITADAVSRLEAGLTAAGRGEVNEALNHYQEVKNAYARIDGFTVKQYEDDLEIAHRSAEETLYPIIEERLREQTMRKARELLGELTMAAGRRDKKKARSLNAELIGLIQEAAGGKDERLKRMLENIDKERQQTYRFIEILEEFDREVRPRLVLRGTITGTGTRDQSRAFFEISAPEGTRSTSLGQGREISSFKELRVVRVYEDGVSLIYRGLNIRMTLGARTEQAAEVSEP